MSSLRVVVAADHGGFPLKQAIAKHLASRGHAVIDVGTTSTEPCDYPVFARAAAEAVASGKAERGVVVDGAGIGSCMMANKVAGVRAGMAFDLTTAKNAREHNDANVLTLGAGYLKEELALQLVDVFLATDCTADRHKRRVALIDAADEPRARPPESAMSPTGHAPPADFEALVERVLGVLRSNPGLAAAPRDHAACRHAACGDCPASRSGEHGCGHCASKRVDTVRSLLGGAGGGRVSSTLGVGAVPQDIAKYIDHTLLKPDATYADIDQLCDEAAKYGFASVCVNPVFVKRCANRLRGSSSVVCTVIGFPLGANTKETKALEARRAIRDGAREVDMVIAIGALKSGDHDYVYDDIRLVAEAARDGGALLKVIIETALLTDDEKVVACKLSKRAHADFVKTSTGFAKGGATAKDVALMADAVEHKLGVKASGGVKSASDALAMIQAGATRIGASVGVRIAQETKGIVPRDAGKASGGGNPGNY